MMHWGVPNTDWLFARRPWRVVLLVALVVGIPILVLGQASADSTRERLRNQELNETTAVAARAADAVSSQVEGILEQLTLAVSISDFRSALEEGDQAQLDDQLRTFHRRMTTDIVRLIALDRSLNVLTLDPPDPSLVGKQIGQHDFLSALRKANLRAEGALYSDLYPADGTTAQVISISIAVLSQRGREGPFSGALVAEFDPSRLATWVEPLLASADEIYLVDREGRLIVRTTAPTDDRGRDLGADPTVSAALAHQAITAEASDPFGRGQHFVSTVELDRLGWHVVVERSTLPLQRSLDEVLNQLLISRVVLVAVLLLASYFIAVALQRVRRLEQREQEHMRRALDRMNEELRIARDIQAALLPKEVQAPSGYQLEAYYQPAADVGGDFYDIVHLPSGRTGVMIGDVTGHGVGAALLMAATVSTLRAEAPLHDSPGKVLAVVNDRLCEEIPTGKFVTCLYAVLDPASGSLSFANAGHPIPYVRTRTGVVEARARGMPLGLIPGSVYEEKAITLADGDHTIFYTDGITEAHRDGEMFGEPRLKEVLAEGMCGQQFIDLLLARIRQLTGPTWEQDDDITLLTLERAAQ